MKLGLALAGGGMRGIAHAGFLKALEENNIKIDFVGGTSSGSHIAFLISIGFSSKEILELFHKEANNLIGNNSTSIVLNSFLFNKKLKLDGLRSGKPIEDIYNKIAKERGIKYIKDVKMPLLITATNVIDEKEYIFTSKPPEETDRYITNIEIGKAIRASSSFSVLFDPCKFEDKIFLDGGILDNVPVDEVRKMGADKVIAIKFNSDRITENSNLMDIAMKTVDMMGNKISEINMLNSDLVVTIDTDGTGLLDIENAEYCFNSGYHAGIENMKKILEII